MINFASFITLSRIFLTPIVIVLLLEQQWFFAMIIFMMAALTDLLDGFVARRWNQQTRFGQLLDPIADKCLLMGTMYSLLMVIHLSGWHFLGVCFLLAKEMILLIVGGFLVYRYNFFIIPSQLSRATSIAEFILIFVMLFALINLNYVPLFCLSMLLISNIILAVWLLVRYVWIIQVYLTSSTTK